jgi:hypothetical protein
MKKTKLFIVIDEATLLTAKGKQNKTAKFRTEKEADEWASQRLEMWSVFKVHFNHKFIKHTI